MKKITKKIHTTQKSHMPHKKAHIGQKIVTELADSGPTTGGIGLKEREVNDHLRTDQIADLTQSEERLLMEQEEHEKNN